MKIKKQPKTAHEAQDLIHEIAKKFNMTAIVIGHADFDDMMGTEKWTNEKVDKAIEIATDEVAEHVGFAIDNAIQEINSNR